MVYDAIEVDLQVHWSRLDILALPNSGQFSAKNRLIVGTSGKKILNGGLPAIIFVGYFWLCVIKVYGWLKKSGVFKILFKFI